MTATTIRVQMAQRKDTAANWTAANPILLSGEIGYETDTKKFKIGNGSTNWNSLAYLPIPDGSGNLTITGNLEIGSTGSLTFEGSTADGFETTLAVTNPTAGRTITLPDATGTVVTTGDTGSVTSTMIANGTIVDADISSTAEIAVSKLANGTANQVIVTDGTNVSWSDNLTLAGDLTVNGTTTTINTQDLLVEDKNIIIGNVTSPTDVTADGGGITLKGATDKTINWVDSTDAWTLSEHINIASGKEYRIAGAKVLDATSLGSSVLITSANITDGTIVNGDISASAAIAGTKISPDFGSQNTATTGTSTAASFIPTSSTVPTNGVYLPAANSVALATNGTGRLFVDASGNVGIGKTPGATLDVNGPIYVKDNGTTGINFYKSTGVALGTIKDYADTFTIRGENKALFLTTVGSYPVQFGSGQSEHMRIDTSGRVGIGTTTVSTKLHIVSNGAGGDVWVANGSGQNCLLEMAGNGNTPQTSSALYGQDSSNNVYGGWARGAHPVLFGTNGTERGRWDSSGRFLVGTSTDSKNIRLQQKLAVVSAGANSYPGAAITAYSGTNTAASPVFDLNRSRGTTDGSMTSVSAGDYLGFICFNGADGTNFAQGATVAAVVEGTPAAGKIGSRLEFSTTADGASSPTERLRLTSTGQLRLAGAGITFNGDTATANELDDYEEGTFTPTITGSTTTGTASYSTQSGKYTKIGRLVQFEVYIGWSSGTGAGNLQISGLPFTVSSSSSTYPAASIGYANDVTLSTTHTPLALLASGSSYIYFYQVPSGGGTNINVPYDSAGSFIVTGTYNV